MNAKVKRMWLKALRSGEYEQGEGALRRNGRYCCLGVLCDLHAKTTKKKWKKETGDGYSYYKTSATLPDEVVDWAGLDDDDPKLSTHKRAAALNDSGRTFNYIANQIEKYL